MSLYFEAANFLNQSNSSLRSRVFTEKALKSQPNQIYALVVEAKKWSPILKEVIENSCLLSLERKLTPELALLLVHDLLLSRKGVAAPASHKLRQAVEKNKARLQAELTKARIRRHCASLEELRSQLTNGLTTEGATANGESKLSHPRWVRINRLKTTFEDQVATTFSGYMPVHDISSIVNSSNAEPGSNLRYHVDKHIPELLALPPNTDLSKERAYLDGELIIQDKASCFPAYLLDPQPEDGIVVDGCAAPGNKTTHLASLMHTTNSRSATPSIIACERDKARANILQEMVGTAGASDLVTVQHGQDFLRIDPMTEPWDKVGALLLDPSCSGSGIIGRDEESGVTLLPSMPINTASVSKKRKRGGGLQVTAEPPDETLEEKPVEGVSKERLKALSGFQIKLVLHALKFPEARKVTYSTCSIHNEENEHVVAAVLNSDIARERGWHILLRDDQVDGMRRWHLRGQQSKTDSLEVDQTVAEACIRCEKHTLDGTQGFFVAAFVREASSAHVQGTIGQEDEDEWSGFDD